ncbi:hypothetical protein C427_2304 [Paraglaciecola psychrophila 170]|uniref:Uncharacterized protein n=1 Tax=Paraglaciecola psychrophila 170 TaxID=1129794 RepID=K7AB95_9ALTE|nr:hypothetical protein C427_2304 [Paraglaciecola psychrophila 170]GAC37968.1 hypothetical protein GPSY_2347 [Paraglaciecola psychrophila 170]
MCPLCVVNFNVKNIYFTSKILMHLQNHHKTRTIFLHAQAYFKYAI